MATILFDIKSTTIPKIIIKTPKNFVFVDLFMNSLPYAINESNSIVTKKEISMGILRTLSNLPSTARTGITTGSVMMSKNFATDDSESCGIHETTARANIIICSALTRATNVYKKIDKMGIPFKNVGCRNYYATALILWVTHHRHKILLAHI